MLILLECVTREHKSSMACCRPLLDGQHTEWMPRREIPRFTASILRGYTTTDWEGMCEAVSEGLATLEKGPGRSNGTPVHCRLHLPSFEVYNNLSRQPIISSSHSNCSLFLHSFHCSLLRTKVLPFNHSQHEDLTLCLVFAG